MKAIILNGNIINWDNVNNIDKVLVEATGLYKIKVNMVNGSAFETEEKYTLDEVKKVMENAFSLRVFESSVVL